MSGSTVPVEDIDTLQTVDAAQSQVEAAPELVATSAAAPVPSGADFAATVAMTCYRAEQAMILSRAVRVATCCWEMMVTIRCWAKRDMIFSKRRGNDLLEWRSR